VRQWVTDRCPSLDARDARDAGTLAKAVTLLNTPALEPARAAVATGGLSVPAGVVVASEVRQLAPLVQPGSEQAVLTGLGGRAGTGEEDAAYAVPGGLGSGGGKAHRRSTGPEVAMTAVLPDAARQQTCEASRPVRAP